MDDDTKRQDIARRLRLLARELLEQTAQERPAEEAEEPARLYPHLCKSCGVPVASAGLCWHCLEEADDGAD